MNSCRVSWLDRQWQPRSCRCWPSRSLSRSGSWTNPTKSRPGWRGRWRHRCRRTWLAGRHSWQLPC